MGTGALAVALAGLTMLSRAASWTDLVAVVVAPLVIVLARWRPELAHAVGAGRRQVALLAAAVLAAGGLSLALGVQKPDQRALVVGAWVLCAVVVAAALAWADRPRRPRWLAWGSVAAVAALGAALTVSLSGVYPLDVWGLHRAAAERLAAGSSPWWGLAVPNASIFTAPGAVITGYPYPLPTLLAYAGAELVAGDPRWAGWLAWILATGVLAGLARSRRDLVLVALLAFTPGWFIVLRNSWTEPLSLALVVGALATWDRRPWVSAALLGLAAVSKQYLGLVLVILVVAPLADRYRRAGVAAAAGLGAWLGGFLLGAGQLQATVGFHLAQPARPDSANLLGALSRVADLGWPGWLGPLVGVVVAVWLARSVRGPASFAWALAGGLTATFLMASQAFPNYWLLVLGLVVGALVLGGGRARVRTDGRGPIGAGGPT